MVGVCALSVSWWSRSSEAAQVIAETNGKEQDHDHVSDTANLSQDKPSKSGTILVK